MQVPQRRQDAHAKVAEGIEGIDDPLRKICNQVAYRASSSCLSLVRPYRGTHLALFIPERPPKESVAAYARSLEKDIAHRPRSGRGERGQSPTLRENDALVRSVPGLGLVLVRTLLAELSELRPSSASGWPLSRASLPSTARLSSSLRAF